MSKSISRKRPREEDQLSYARRLVHQCQKDLHKQAKICRNFECQRVSRKLKQEHKESQVTLLQKWRHLPLEPVLDLCFRRLGMLDVVQTVSAMKDDDKQKKKGKEKTAGAPRNEGMDNPEEGVCCSQKVAKERDHEVEESMLEQILGQKKMRDAMEVWSIKVAEYRKWCSRHHQTAKDDRTPANKEAEDEDDSKAQVDASHSIFTTLGNQDDGKKKKKKNRPGQKARQAKSAEIVATNSQSQQPSQPSKKASTAEVLHPSWEARKAQKVSISAFQGKKITFGSEETKEKPDAENSLHPSWEARKTQKNSIVAFQGKKITFD